MQRRQFLLGTLAASAALSSGALIWLATGDQKPDLSISSVLATLQEMDEQAYLTTGSWDLYQILTHCAQSIEYSISGFPEHKPEWFKDTLGVLAFTVFARKGEMYHALDEPIPGSQGIQAGGDVRQAYQRLQQTLLDFQHHDGPLHAHFAYGALSKQDYALAHAMHFYNHLQEIQL
ncbi:DUF1569 domain-containing protein [Lacimicrobium sp. SS2-24]|uniref:DUF1569 domain-containing protein n=1 Tax=Lacimicrobium sp. SS2-24 TaxID=2005569 RepID=UPI000B4BD4D7|nr:DUF1569 domain-containing protein [Lacimicrobium sp. SS2-24]